jgi:hypothetical protein
MNSLLATSGEGYILSLCPSTQYVITAPIQFAAPNQEISTQGYPTDDTRATLVVFGPVANGTGHTTAVDGTCSNCDGVKLRHVQVRIELFASVLDINLKALLTNTHFFFEPPDQWHTSRRCPNLGWRQH